MSLSATNPRIAYAGNGSTTVFSVPFQFFLAADLKVYSTDTTTFVETLQVLDTDYLVSGGDGSTGSIAFITAPASGKTITIVGDPAAAQTLDLEENGPLPADDVETAFDKVVAIVKRAKDLVSRSLRQPETELVSLSALPVKTDRASNFLAFDSDGNPIASSGSVPDAVAVSTFMETVLDDTSATAARATLGTPDAIELLSNKKLQDSTTTIVDNSDNTKAVKFEVSSITTANTRTVTIPDADLTLAGIATTQTLTNKTMSGSSNTFSAIPLADQSSEASTAGQVLVSTGSAACSWQTPPVAVAYRSTNLSLTSGVTTDVIADTEVIDSASAYNNTTGVFTVPAGQGGLYEIGASLILACSSAFNGTTEIFAFDLAGSQSVNLLQTVPVSASVNLHYAAVVLVNLSAGDTAKITAIQDSGSGHNIIGNVASRIWFRKIPG